MDFIVYILIYKTRRYLNKQTLTLVLNSLFISHIQYGILCWARCSKTYMKPLLSLFNNALKCINFCTPKDKNVDRLYHSHNILKVNDMFKLELGKFMYKYNKNMLPNTFTQYFKSTTTVHNYNTRNSKTNYFIPRQKSNKGLSTLSYLEAKLWSEIPNTIKTTNTIGSFSTNYKELLLNNYISKPQL